MLRWIHILFVVALANGLVAQAILLPGEIAIQNSKYETGVRRYVQGASIRAPFAKAVTSDKDGQFTLGFTGVQNGTPARLTVEKTGMEVVNTKETQQVILGRAPRITVVMADAQKLAEAQVAYYNIATGSIAKNYERKMRALRDDNVGLEERLAALNTAYGKQLATLEAAIGLLTDEREQAMDNARELALELASADLDNASQLYIKAFELFKRGELDSVLVVLGEERLKADYDKVMVEKERTIAALDRENSTIAQLYASYQLKVKVLDARGAIRSSMEVTTQMATMVEQNPDAFGPTVPVELQWEIARGCKVLAEFGSATSAIEKGFAIAERTLGPDHPASAGLWLVWAEIQMNQDHLDTALVLLDKGLAVLALAGPAEVPLEAELMGAKARVYYKQGKHHQAMAAARRALAIQTRILPPMHEDFSPTYGLIGSIAFRFNDSCACAFEYTQCALEMNWAKNNPGTITLRSNMGVIRFVSGDHRGGIELISAAVGSMARTMGEDHPNTAELRCILGWCLYLDDQYTESLVEYEKALPILEKIYGPSHFLVLSSSSRKATILIKLDRDEEAEVLIRQTLERAGSESTSDQLEMADLNWDLSRALKGQGKADEAMVAIERTIDIYEKTLPVGHRLISNALVDKADLLMMRKDYREALDLLLPVLRTQQASTAPPVVLNYSNTHCRIGMAYYYLQQLDSASISLHESYCLKAISPSAWFLYKIANDQHDDQQALDWLVSCARLYVTDRGLRPTVRQESLDALKSLATKLGRTDILDEFKLH